MYEERPLTSRGSIEHRTGAGKEVSSARHDRVRKVHESTADARGPLDRTGVHVTAICPTPTRNGCDVRGIR